MTSMEPSQPGIAVVDVVGVGNALVDVLVHAPDDLVASLGLTRGEMSLVDEERQAEVYSAVGAGIEASGGSAANTVVAVASLGGTATYIGRVRDDQLGRVFAHDLRATGVHYDTPLATDGPATGSCLVLVAPDAERTMNTFLGASTLLGPDLIDPAVVGSGRVVYLEGYLFDPPLAQEAFKFAAEIAHAAGREVALTLSDSFCVERHRDAFIQLLDDHIDILFANESEARSLTLTDSFDDACAALVGRASVVVITRSEAGAVALTVDGVVSVPAVPVEVVATTGAGDAFAAGFLVGHTRDLGLETSLRLGAVAAAEVISHLGPRPAAELSQLAASLLNS